MNRKRLITGMTVILLLAVYTGMYIVLPAARQTVPKELLYWTAGMADLIRVKKAAMAY